MIYYKAVCRIHGWESPGLYKSRADAIRSARAHRNNNPSPHQITILEVYISNGAIEIKSEFNLWSE